MDIGPILERHPQLEEVCREQISQIHKEIIGAEPLIEVQDYVLNFGVKNNATRPTLMQDFQIIFNDRTEDLVKWLFENLAPRIKLEAAKIEKTAKPGDFPTGTGLPAAASGTGQSLVDAFDHEDD